MGMTACGFGLSLLASFFLILAPSARADDAAALSAEQQSFKLPGDGPWDYVSYDPTHQRVFIGRYNGVLVVRADTGKLEATIGARTGDHGAVIAADQRRVFTSDAAARRLGVYDQASLAAQRNVPLGGEPDGLAYDPVSHRVLAFLPRTHEIVAVDAATLRVVGRLNAGGEPEAAVADGRGRVFITLRDQGEVIRVNAGTLRVRARWKIGCERPSPIAMDADAARLFVGCRDRQMLVLDAASGREMTALPTGKGTDGLAFDAARKLVIAANGGGSITLVRMDDPDHYAVHGTIAMPRGARTMALDAEGGRLFTVTSDIAAVQAPTRTRPYPRLIPQTGTFRMIVVKLPS